MIFSLLLTVALAEAPPIAATGFGKEEGQWVLYLTSLSGEEVLASVIEEAAQEVIGSRFVSQTQLRGLLLMAPEVCTLSSPDVCYPRFNIRFKIDGYVADGVLHLRLDDMQLIQQGVRKAALRVKQDGFWLERGSMKQAVREGLLCMMRAQVTPEEDASQCQSTAPVPAAQLQAPKEREAMSIAPTAIVKADPEPVVSKAEIKELEEEDHRASWPLFLGTVMAGVPLAIGLPALIGAAVFGGSAAYGVFRLATAEQSHVSSTGPLATRMRGALIVDGGFAAFLFTVGFFSSAIGAAIFAVGFGAWWRGGIETE